MSGARGMNYYTDEEKVWLRENYAKRGPVACAAHLRRPASSVRAQARKLGVTQSRGWTKIKNPTHRVDPRVALPEAPPPPLEVSPRLRRLAAFDPMLARVVKERESGAEAGSFINKWEATFG